jgi:hypothetical protein
MGHDQPAAGWIRVAAARDLLVVDDNDRHLDILSAILMILSIAERPM